MPNRLLYSSLFTSLTLLLDHLDNSVSRGKPFPICASTLAKWCRRYFCSSKALACHDSWVGWVWRWSKGIGYFLSDATLTYMVGTRAFSCAIFYNEKFVGRGSPKDQDFVQRGQSKVGSLCNRGALEVQLPECPDLPSPLFLKLQMLLMARLVYSIYFIGRPEFGW